MNFENYKGKRIRLSTNLIDEETNRYKVIEGVYEGYESLGSNHYIIVDGESYPEVCILSFGLLVEKPKEEVIEYIPAYTLQVDPFDMINEKIDEIEKDYSEDGFVESMNVKDRFKSALWWDIGKVTALLFIIVVFAIISSIGTYTHDDYTTVTTKTESYSTMYPNPSKSCLIIDNKLTCSQEVQKKDLEV